MTSEERDDQVLALYERVLEIEQRLIPTGLHTFGKPSVAAETVHLLAMVASFPRPEIRIPALTDLIASGLGLLPYSELLQESQVSSKRMRERELVETLVRETIRRLLASGEQAQQETVLWLQQRAGVATDSSREVLVFLANLHLSLQSNRELDGLVSALRGDYLPPGPGGDLLQNPGILPTGRNTHAINPYAIPSALALRRAEPLTRDLLERHQRETGRIPESIAMVLWGIDNIKKEGEAVAQVLWLLGVKPVRDGLNRVTEVEAIPLEQLGHPRIDVVMTVSGIFRDLFATTVELLDRAVKRVAALDEPLEQNFVRKNVQHQMAQGQSTFEEAATRVFSNAAGNYGTNVNFMVLQSQWEDARELGDLFVKRKCFAYGRDAQGRSLEGEEAQELLDSALSRVEVSYQNIDSTEVGIADVDHYFEYLGGVTKAVEQRSGKRPQVYLSDSLTPNARVRTLKETLQLESRTKVLNPKWYEGMLKHGFSGVAEIEHQLTNTFGWSATADAVEDWIYDEVAETFVLDSQMLQRLQSLNPHSAQTLVGRLLEASGRGFWSASPEVLSRLREVFAGLEDTLEGVAP